MAKGQARVDVQKLRDLRERKRYDQTEFASRLRGRGLGTTQATVSRWEHGQEPRAYQLPAIAAELGVTVDELYAIEGEDDDVSSSPLGRDLASALQAEVQRQVRAALKAVRS